MKARKWISLALVIVVLATTVMACGGKEPPITVELNLEPCTYTAGDVEYDADCGTLVVPENRSDPNSRMIELPVIRVRALSDNPTEPIFWLAGGPGHTNMHFSNLDGLIDNHDIVLVGYRGADGSVVLDCPEVTEALTSLGSKLTSDESFTSIGSAYTRCAVRLQDEGVDLDGYTVPEVAEDMEAARIGLGYQRINLLSQSYGTRVAMIYSWRHPDSLYRVVMIAVNPPGHFVWEPDVIDVQIEYDADLCAQDPECSARTDDLAETVRNVAHNMPDHWQSLPIDPGKVRLITHMLLCNHGSAAIVYDAYITAEEGDPSGLAYMSQMFDSMMPTAMTFGESAAKASIDFDPARDYITEMDPPDSIIGAPMSFAWGWLQASDWPMATIPAELRQVQP